MKTRVLVVEDESIVAKDIQKTLQKLGYDVSGVASTGQEALEKAVKHRPEVILMDIMLKGDIDGIETARRIHLHLKAPVVYLTAYSDAETLGRATQTEPYGYILKPFEDRALSSSIEVAVHNAKKRQALETKESIYAASFENLGGAVIITDMESRVTYLNPQAAFLTGWSRREADRKLVGDILRISSEGTPISIEAFAERALKEFVIMGMSNRMELISKDGQRMPIESYGAPVRDRRGEISGAVFLIHDISEYRQAQSTLEKAQDDLEKAHSRLIQAAKMESVGRLAAGVVHEVKNPLAVLLQGLEYLSRRLPAGDKEMQSIIEDMNAAVQRANRVIRGLLDFSSPREVQMEIGDVNRVVEQSLMFVKHDLAAGHVSVVKELEKDLASTRLDIGKLEQVFVNVFINAVHAMPGGGTLTVRTAVRTVSSLDPGVGRRHSDRFRPNERVVVVEVEDTGSGIPEDQLDKIFDPFYTTKESKQGTGLGLSVTQKIMELHEGVIDIRNRPGGGARVTLLLQVAD